MSEKCLLFSQEFAKIILYLFKGVFWGLDFLAELFSNKLLYIFTVSMLPVVELRGSIVLAAAWDLSIVPTYLVAVLGNLLPVPFIILFARKILSILKHMPFLSHFAERYEHRIVAKAEEMNSLTFWGLVIFVAIPLPGTGAWTGSFLAALLKMPYFKSFLAIALGVMIAGVIMVCAAYGVIGFLSFLV